MPIASIIMEIFEKLVRGAEDGTLTLLNLLHT